MIFFSFLQGHWWAIISSGQYLVWLERVGHWRLRLTLCNVCVSPAVPCEPPPGLCSSPPCGRAGWSKEIFTSRPSCLLWELTSTPRKRGQKGVGHKKSDVRNWICIGSDFCCATWSMVWVSSKDFLVSSVWARLSGYSPSTQQIHWSLLLLHCKLTVEQYTSSRCPLVRTCRGILNHGCPFSSAPHPGKDTGYRITKKCSADCPETNMNFGVAAISTKCCGTSLCNFSGANSVKISYAVMLLGIVASLVCVIRAGLWWGLQVGEDLTTQRPARSCQTKKPTPSKCLHQGLCYYVVCLLFVFFF